MVFLDKREFVEQEALLLEQLFLGFSVLGGRHGTVYVDIGEALEFEIKCVDLFLNAAFFIHP